MNILRLSEIVFKYIILLPGLHCVVIFVFGLEDLWVRERLSLLYSHTAFYNSNLFLMNMEPESQKYILLHIAQHATLRTCLIVESYNWC